MASKTAIDETNKLNPVLRTILQGVADCGCEFSKLRGVPHLIQKIWELVTFYWKLHIKVSSDISHLYFVKYFVPTTRRAYFDAPAISYEISFPKPSDININMMPFIMSHDFHETKLPKYLKKYWRSLIDRCINKDELGKIGYLTVQESEVDQNISQRRPGLHVETPGVALLSESTGEEVLIENTSWGLGDAHYLALNGGIFMASTVSGSCQIWNCKILHAENGPGVIGELGDIEHLREFLPEGVLTEANVIYWMTDRTPHESLPLQKGTYRQFFRLVTSQVSLWYEDHSTKNPLGVVPDPNLTKIVKGSKFETCGLVIVEDNSSHKKTDKKFKDKFKAVFNMK